MTPLGAHLARQIAATGPMSLADYMAACLMHPSTAITPPAIRSAVRAIS